MLVPDPLRNGCITRHLRWSLSLAEEHPLILGAVVARAQVVLGGVAVDLVVDEEVDLVVPNRSGRTCDALRSYHVRGSMARRTARRRDPGMAGGVNHGTKT